MSDVKSSHSNSTLKYLFKLEFSQLHLANCEKEIVKINVHKNNQQYIFIYIVDCENDLHCVKI